jgi:hypothetical protein
MEAIRYIVDMLLWLLTLAFVLRFTVPAGRARISAIRWRMRSSASRTG